MKNWIAAIVFLALAVSAHGAAKNRVPVMVLPFENKTEIKTLDRFTSWIKTELGNYDNIRLIDFYKSTNINGTLLLFLKPSQEFLFNKPKTGTASQNLPDTYYIVTGTITYTDYRYYIHADVINSTTEWVIAKDDVYISDLGNIRKVLVQELGKRLSLKMNFRQVERFNEQRVIANLTNTNTNAIASAQTNAQGKKQTAVMIAPPPPPPPPPPLIEQENLFNEKKQVLIVFNTNEKKVLEDLKKKQEGGSPEPENTNAFKKPKEQKTAKLENQEPEFKFYNSPHNNELSFQPLISGDYKVNSNAIFTSYELSYKRQIAPSFYIGINLGFGLFDVKGPIDDPASFYTNFQYNIYEFRIVPQALYRWYFVQPFFVDLGVGIGGHFGSVNYTSLGYVMTNTNYNTMNGYILQGRGGVGVELGRMTMAFYFAWEGQNITYIEVTHNFFVSMTMLGLSLGVEF